MQQSPDRKLRLVVLGFVGLVVVGAALKFLFDLGYNKGYAPEQPIPFSHRIHAGTYKIPCMYCHTGIEKSRHATVPAMNVCMNCHSVVKPESPHIQKLKSLYNDQKKPFEWVRVHDLPDHVFFPHNRHIARGLQCDACHGDVAHMDRVTQQHSLSMGWCINCHRGHTAPDYLFEKGQPRGPVAPTNCNTCHQ